MEGHTCAYILYLIITDRLYCAYRYKYIQEEVLQFGHFKVGKSTTYKYQQHLKHITTTLAPHYMIAIGEYLPENTMDATSTKPMPNKDIDQYSESTLIELFKLTGFETQVLLNEKAAASLSLSLFNNMII